MTKLRITIIGTRHMGKIHYKIIKENLSEQAVVCGVINSRNETTQAAAKEFNVTGYNNFQEINTQNTDAIVISTPGNTHYQIAKELITKKIPLLIEKPFAETPEQCAELIKLAHENGTPIMVGHTENYNPAVIKLHEQLKAPITSISGIRTSRNGAKNGSQIISELMIHDLAIINSLIKSDPQQIKVSKNKMYTWGEHAIVSLSYSSGTHAKLEAENTPQTPIKREMILEDEDQNIWHIDFLKRKLSKNDKILCEGGNSLVNEWQDFINMIKNGKTPQTNINEAAHIVSLCNKIENLTKSYTSIILNQPLADKINRIC